MSLETHSVRISLTTQDCFIGFWLNPPRALTELRTLATLLDRNVKLTLTLIDRWGYVVWTGFAGDVTSAVMRDRDGAYRVVPR